MNGLDEEIARLKRRKEKLETLVKLQREVALLECQLVDSSMNEIKNQSAKRIVDVVCRSMGVNLGMLLEKDRTGNVVLARHTVFYLLRELVGMNFSAIGRLTKRDHGTVMHGVDVLRGLIETDRKVADQVTTIRQACCEEIVREN